jgi:hypothetical protein
MYPEEHPGEGRSPDDALEARLRDLPPPPVPAGLEARLLAAIPPALSLAPEGTTRVNGWRRRPLWIAAGCALAAACLLVVFLWRGRDFDNAVPKGPANQAALQEPGDSADQRMLLQARRDLEEAEMPAFSWPFEETPSMRPSISLANELSN